MGCTNRLEYSKVPQSAGIHVLYTLQYHRLTIMHHHVCVKAAARVVCMCRWPLLIDPQLQGTRWVKQRGHDSLITVSVNRDRWLTKITDAIRNGDVLLIENLSESIDPVLDPLVSRSVSRKVC